MQNVYLHIMSFCVSILGWAAKKTFPKNSQVHVIHSPDFVYSGEVAYMKKPSVAQMVMDTFSMKKIRLIRTFLRLNINTLLLRDYPKRSTWMITTEARQVRMKIGRSSLLRE